MPCRVGPLAGDRHHQIPVISRRVILGIGGMVGIVPCRRSRIIGYDEYVGMRHSLPYVLRFERRRGALFFFGSDHVFDAAHPQTEQIERAWAKFRPSMAFNEGGDPPTESSVRLAVSRYGESGLVRFLAHRDRVPVSSIEPTLVQQVDLLRQAGYGADEIKLFFVLRQVPQHRERTGVPPTDTELQAVLDAFGSVQGLEGAPNGIDDVVSALKRGDPELEDWRGVPQAWFDPALEQPPSYMNEVSRRLSEYRDEHAVDVLVRSVRDGQRVFAVMGASHVVVQEPALRARLGRALVVDVE
jgi:hypothetical protein